jgi:excinuclease ABC subunit C
MKKNDSILFKTKNLPELPGIYKYFDSSGKIIYIGKAKNLKKRVSSYFVGNQHNGKTKILISHISEIDYVVVETELDALLLENNLIKQHKPKYNILLKDDKTFPWICVKNEPFPRVFSTRTVTKDGSKYYGPYSNVKSMHGLIALVKELYPLRNCNLDLQKNKIEAGSFKVCLEYHIGNCLGPCEGKQTSENYLIGINYIEEILKGKVFGLIQLLKKKMVEHAHKFEYEEAQFIKNKIEILKNFQSKSMIVSPKIQELDVITIVEDNSTKFVNYLHILEGAIVHGHTFEVKTKLDESINEILTFSLIEMRSRFNSTSKEVISDETFALHSIGLLSNVPKVGDKKHLIELSKRNAKFYCIEKRKQERLINPDKHKERILQTIKTDFRLKDLPIHIECFDNSNIQGEHAVSACVVFKEGRPSKKDYRHFNIKTVVGPDDFASMEEVVYRRYKRLIEENQSLPQLIVIDGGKGQLSSALTALEKLDLRGKIAIVGIAKKLEEIFFPGDSIPIYLDKRSESLKVIQHMRNEAHRFGITHHRNKRSKAAIQSEILDIVGIGSKTQELLYKQFKTVKGIKNASLEELISCVGQAKANLIVKNIK